MINEEVRYIIEAELMDGEELLWADKPSKRPYPWRGVYRAGFWCVWMLFVFVFICISVFSDSSRSNVDPSLIIRLIFICVGIAMFFGGYVLRKTHLKAFLGPKYEVYGLTDKRAIVLSPLWKDQKFINWRGQDHSRNSIDGEDLETIKVELSSDQSMGTIIFSGWWDKIRYTRYTNLHPDTPKLLSNLNGFRNIPNVASVANLIVDKFGAVTNLAETHHNTDYRKATALKKIRTKRVVLWSTFPFTWIVFTITRGRVQLAFPFFSYIPVLCCLSS